MRKRGEHMGRSVQQTVRGKSPGEASCVPPAQYQERFM
eukprot:gene28193-10043_t